MTTSATLSQRNNQEQEAVRSILANLWNASFGGDWPGKAGLTAWSAYKALLRKAWHHSEIIHAGVWVSISMRQWARETGVESEAINNAQKWLKEAGLIRRDGRGQGPKESGAFVLLVSPLGARSTETLIQEQHRRDVASKTTYECFDSARVGLRWSAPGERRLGKTKEALLDALHHLGKSATDRELAIAIGRGNRVRDIRAHLDELVDEGILKRHGRRYHFHEHTGIELATTRVVNGEIDADERQKERHEREQQAFAMAWEAGEVVGKTERRKRERWAYLREEREGATTTHNSLRQEDAPRSEEDEAIRETLRTSSEFFELARARFGSSQKPMRKPSRHTLKTVHERVRRALEANHG